MPTNQVTRGVGREIPFFNLSEIVLKVLKVNTTCWCWGREPNWLVNRAEAIGAKQLVQEVTFLQIRG